MDVLLGWDVQKGTERDLRYGTCSSQLPSAGRGSRASCMFILHSTLKPAHGFLSQTVFLYQLSVIMEINPFRVL